MTRGFYGNQAEVERAELVKKHDDLIRQIEQEDAQWEKARQQHQARKARLYEALNRIRASLNEPALSPRPVSQVGEGVNIEESIVEYDARTAAPYSKKHIPAPFGRAEQR